MKTIGRILRVLSLIYLGAWLHARMPATYHVMTVDMNSGKITTGFGRQGWRFVLGSVRCSNVGPACSHPHRWHLKQSASPDDAAHA